VSHCRGKAAYRSRQAALDALRRIVIDPQAFAPAPCRTYRCRNCGRWHLTSLIGKRWRNHA
jgi:hypothetical protein